MSERLWKAIQAAQTSVLEDHPFFLGHRCRESSLGGWYKRLPNGKFAKLWVDTRQPLKHRPKWFLTIHPELLKELEGLMGQWASREVTP